jgi:UDP-N-acetylglucosamine 2-epimerase
VEAGLRTDDLQNPFPEEYFRKTISQTASVHLTPTATATERLIAEGVDPETIIESGNTVIDNLRQFYTEESNDESAPKNLILVTIHRRENIHGNLKNIISRIGKFAKESPEIKFEWLDNPGYKIAPDLKEAPANLRVIPPLSFKEMLEVYKKTKLIITDSGGIQEEAAFLGIPVLICREKTERPEGVAMGISKYMDSSDEMLEDILSEMTKKIQPGFNNIYGDGFAAQRIADFLERKEFL